MNYSLLNMHWILQLAFIYVYTHTYNRFWIWLCTVEACGISLMDLVFFFFFFFIETIEKIWYIKSEDLIYKIRSYGQYFIFANDMCPLIREISFLFGFVYDFNIIINESYPFTSSFKLFLNKKFRYIIGKFWQRILLMEDYISCQFRCVL